jgi:hypothetical protein
MAETTSRIEDARARAAGAKRSLGAAAAIGFVSALVLAYVSHSGATQATSGGSSGDGTSLEDDDWTFGGFEFGSGSIAPSTRSAPQARTNAS